jgi:hypothetical protein
MRRKCLILSVIEGRFGVVVTFWSLKSVDHFSLTISTTGLPRRALKT